MLCVVDFCGDWLHVKSTYIRVMLLLEKERDRDHIYSSVCVKVGGAMDSCE